jgi:hypothetical protein
MSDILQKYELDKAGEERIAALLTEAFRLIGVTNPHAPASDHQINLGLSLCLNAFVAGARNARCLQKVPEMLRAVADDLDLEIRGGAS